VRARLIANPQAGADLAPTYIPLITEKLRSLVGEIDVTISTSVADTERIAARTLSEHYDALYVAGGDGTLNAALRGLLSDVGGTSPIPVGTPIPIGVVPLGTGNDFAKALDLGEEPEAALDALLEGRVIDVDVGLVNDHPFVNTSAGGFIADVSEKVTETLKNAAGKLAYLVGGARALFGTEPFSARLAVHDDDVSRAARPVIDVQLFAVCNARFIGGGYPIAPDALIDDGLLDVLMVRRMPLMEFVAVLQRLATGQHRNDPAVLRFRSAAFELEFDRTVRVNTDGELLEASRCRYQTRRGSALFFCGASPQSTRQPRAWLP
jgi:diacylglycerol kinase (ATP)